MHVPALVEFLSGLEQNNNRPYFVWHKPAYDVLREEFEVLTGELVARVAKFDPGLGPVDVKKALFRIYRDTRFSKDKTPYKTHFSAAIRDRAKKGLEPGYYFHIDRHGVLMAGGGIYNPDEEALARPPKGFAADTPHIEAIKLKHYFALIEVNILKRPPKDLAGAIAGYFRDALPLMRWLRRAVAAERP
jgi:uncharacterized protein (DUF2461 family)